MLGITLFALALAIPAPAATRPDRTEIQIDMPWRAEPNRPYQLHLLYHIAANEQDPNRKKSRIRIHTDDNGQVEYAVRQIELEPEKQTDLEIVRMHETPSGLTWVRVNTTDLPPDAGFAALSIDLGFRGRVHWPDKTAVESWHVTSAPLQISDAAGKPLPVNAPIIVDVTASNARIRFRNPSAEYRDLVTSAQHARRESEWSDSATTGVAIGQSDAGTLEVEPRLFGSGHGVLHIRGYINDRSQMVFDAVEPFDIVTPWFIRLAVAILGGLTFTLYHAMRNASPLLRSFPAGVVAGALAWALSDSNLLGIRADTSRLTGYFVLGLVVAYTGVEALLLRIVRSEKKQASGATDESHSA